MTSGSATSFFIAGWVIVMAFFQPFLWWQTTVGYIAGVIFGIFGGVTSAIALINRGSLGELPAEGAYILIPALIFALLLIGGSVLAWWEG